MSARRFGFCLVLAPADSGPGARGPGTEPRTAEPVEQVVYVRPVPNSDWHIATFMPVGRPEEESGPSAVRAADELMQRGLRLSGLSLAGLAGLLLMPGARGKKEHSG